MNDSLSTPILLMTASVDPRGCLSSRFDPQCREKQYASALRFYLRVLRDGGPCVFKRIVFAENSGWDLENLRAIVPDEFKSSVEFLSIPIDDFVQERGKSYNEMLLINKACTSSMFLSDPSTRFVKVTGRYPIWNIKRMFKNISQNESADFFFELHSTKPLVDTRCVMFRKEFWLNEFGDQYRRADNSTGSHFETLVYELLVECFQDWNLGFFTTPLFITGLQGAHRKFKGVTIPDFFYPPYMFSIFVYHLVNKFLRRDRRLLRNTELSSR